MVWLGKEQLNTYQIRINPCRGCVGVVGSDRLLASGGIGSCNYGRLIRRLVENLKGTYHHIDSGVSSPNPERTRKQQDIRSRRKDL